MKLNMLSMFWVRVCWMSLRRWVGNVWKVITSSASLNRINITSSVWASYEGHKWILVGHDSLTFDFNKSMTAAKMCWWIATWWRHMKMNMTNPLVLTDIQVIAQSFSNCMLAGKANRLPAQFKLLTPSLVRASISFSISGQCWGHSLFIISTVIRDRASLIWLSSSRIERVPW